MKPQVIRWWSGVAIVLAIAIAASVAARAQQRGNRPPADPAAANANDVRAVPVQGNVYLIVGAGSNIVASVGDSGVLLVDAGTAAASEKVLAAIRGVTAKPIQFIINTNFQESHTGGNEALSKAGRRLPDGNSQQAVVLAHENVLTRMSAPTGQVSPRPVSAWPTDTFFAKRKDVFFNGEAVRIFYRPARTDADSFVFFRKSDVIAAGDIYSTVSYPMVDIAAGGNINGVIAGLNNIMALAVPANNVEDGTVVIPGTGRLSDLLDIAVYRDMVTIIRDRVQDAIKHGQSLAQVKADKRITLEYDGRYGATTGAWTTDMFLDAVYRSLKPQTE